MPIAVEVFEGNPADATTLSNAISKLRDHFRLNTVDLVGERGMLTGARIREEVRPVQSLESITCLRSDAIRKLAQEHGPLQPSLFDVRDLAQIQHPDFPSDHLVACFNPLLQAES